MGGSKTCSTLHLKRILRLLVESPEPVTRLEISKQTNVNEYVCMDDGLKFLLSLGLIEESRNRGDGKLFSCSEEQKEHLKSMKSFGGEL